MIGAAALRGAPLSPRQVLQTRSLAPRMAWASAVLPTARAAGTSGMCPAGFAAFSAALAGMASAARTTRTPKTVGKRLLIMFAPRLFEGTRSPDATYASYHVKHAAVRLVAQDATISLVLSGRRKFETVWRAARWRRNGNSCRAQSLYCAASD